MIEAFEAGVLDLRDFFFTGDDYRYRFEAEAKQRFIDLFRERFNAGVTCRGRVLNWDTVVELKTNELGRFIAGKSPVLDFVEPAPTLERQDSRELRAKILSLTSSEAKQLGLPKQSLHDLRIKASSKEPFKLHDETRMKLQTWSSWHQ